MKDISFFTSLISFSFSASIFKCGFIDGLTLEELIKTNKYVGVNAFAFMVAKNLIFQNRELSCPYFACVCEY